MARAVVFGIVMGFMKGPVGEREGMMDGGLMPMPTPMADGVHVMEEGATDMTNVFLLVVGRAAWAFVEQFTIQAVSGTTWNDRE